MTDTLADYAARGTAILPQPWNLVALAVAATLAALLLHWVVFRLLRRVVGRTRSEADEMLVRRLAMPTRFALVALALVLAPTLAQAVLWVRLWWRRAADQSRRSPV